jgi:hypothetical protein
VKIDVSHFVETEEMQFIARVCDVEFTITGSILMPVTKVNCGPRETTISRDW